MVRIRISDVEWFLLEYREPRGGDAALPAAGVLLYHVRDTLRTQPIKREEIDARSYRVTLVQADRSDHLLRPESDRDHRGRATDAFGMLGKNGFRPADYPQLRTLDGAPIPFEITSVILEPSLHRARVTIAGHPN